MNLPYPTAAPRSFRRDGWTAKRQLTFLSELVRTRSVTKAARAAGMSRESAYRLRNRDPHGLFAGAWVCALKVHKAVTSGAARKRRERREFVGFQPMWNEGHEVDDTLFPLPSPRTP